jgi:hypothetical protein
VVCQTMWLGQVTPGLVADRHATSAKGKALMLEFVGLLSCRGDRQNPSGFFSSVDTVLNVMLLMSMLPQIAVGWWYRT